MDSQIISVKNEIVNFSIEMNSHNKTSVKARGRCMRSRHTIVSYRKPTACRIRGRPKYVFPPRLFRQLEMHFLGGNKLRRPALKNNNRCSIKDLVCTTKCMLGSTALQPYNIKQGDCENQVFSSKSRVFACKSKGNRNDISNVKESGDDLITT